MVTELTIDEAVDGQRADNFLIKHYKGVPKSRLYRALRNGEVRANKKRIKADYRLKAGDVLRLPPLRQGPVPETLPPDERLLKTLKAAICYEDEGLFVINKPAGIPVHGGTGAKTGVVEALRHLFPQQRFLELAHRLDKGTSGLLILAKKRSALLELHQQLREGKVEKHYLATVKGKFPRKTQTVTAKLRKNELKSGERVVIVANDGKPSETILKPLERNETTSVVEAILKTGRTHQIRVHCAHVGFPIAGDDKYGDKTFNKTHRLKTLRLHAYQLQFQLSYMDEPLCLTAYPDWFSNE